MPTIITHPIVPLALCAALGSQVISPRLAAVGAVASIVPDADVAAFHLGISYADDFGHRGFTHSLLFAAILGAAAIPFAQRLRSTSLKTFLFVFFAAASHGLLDAFTNGGLGVASLWPFSDERFFAPARMIEVSPIGLSRFLSDGGLSVLKSEFIWVWLPCLSLAAACFIGRRSHSKSRH